MTTSSNHYVYVHINPDDFSIVYVGKGSKERAWNVRRRGSAPHSSFLNNLEALGYCPADWAFVLYSGLTLREALDLERELILKIRPIFNRFLIDVGNAGHGEDNPRSKLTAEMVLEIRRLYEETNLSHRQLAELFNVSKSAITSVISRRTWDHV